MNRKLKNILMIGLLIILIIVNVFTINSLKDNNKNNMIPNEFREEMGMQIGNRPEMPQGDMGMIEPNGMQRQQGMYVSDSIFKGILVLEYLIISLLIIYLLMSNFNKKDFKETFKNSDKIIIYILGVIVLTYSLNLIPKNILNNQNINGINMEENTKKETTGDMVDGGEKLSDKEIDLSNHNSNITITEAGEYTLTGSFNYSVLVDATGDVILNLDNVEINSKDTAAIANISNNELIINLVDDTTNTLKDAGSSEYDGCIYSTGLLTIKGKGSLNIYGNQEEGEGIATTDNSIIIENGNIYVESNDDGINAGGDLGGTITIKGGNTLIKASGDGIDSNDNIIIEGGTVYAIGSSVGGDAGIDADNGFEINDGLVIALGSDMLETPLNSSKQNVLCFNLNNKIKSGTLITLMSEDDVIVSFEAKEDFKTLIISSKELEEGTYYLYQNGKNTGTLKNGIYYDGDYTKGDKIKEATLKEKIAKIS